jgi:hypothetical protein
VVISTRGITNVPLRMTGPSPLEMLRHSMYVATTFLGRPCAILPNVVGY